jgi:hypothetical protein
VLPTHAQPTTLQARVQMRDLAAAGYAAPALRAILGRPVPTVRTWRRIAQRQTRPALTSHVGRRTTGALRTFPHALHAHLRHLRDPHRGWGAQPIRADLRRDPGWGAQPVNRRPILHIGHRQ